MLFSNDGANAFLECFSSQCTRFLVNNSSEHGFYHDVRKLLASLSARGYPSTLQIPRYDVAKRFQFLMKFRCRDMKTDDSRNSPMFHSEADGPNFERRQIVCVVPFHTELHKFRLLDQCKTLTSRLGLNVDIKIVFTIANNMFLKTYRLNTPSNVQRCQAGVRVR